jgi:hypothetical protein
MMPARFVATCNPPEQRARARETVGASSTGDALARSAVRDDEGLDDEGLARTSIRSRSDSSGRTSTPGQSGITDEIEPASASGNGLSSTNNMAAKRGDRAATGSAMELPWTRSCA